MSRPRLLLINPVNPLRTGFAASVSSRFPPLNLGILAGMAGPEWEVELIDENFETFTHRDADLVALTAFTSSVNRGYEIADHYRRLGVPVVIGGIHASMCPGEAQQFADTVVTGEAESVWLQLLADARNGRLAPLYAGALTSLTDRPQARRDLFHPGYIFGSIQTSRGCPMDCDFCSVTTFNGRRYRRRPNDEVLAELETIPQELLFIVDDNIIGYGTADRAQTLELFRGMVDRGIQKQWFCQASVNVADDPEVLDWASRAGCKMIFLGIEAEDGDALGAVNKRLNKKRGSDAYGEIFRRIHDAGIAVLGAFIFGIDGDTPDKLRRRADYIIDSDVDVVQMTAMTPLPGTKLFKQFEKEGRLRHANFPADWDRYNLTEVVFEPRDMTVHEFTHTMRECLDRVYDMKVLKAKAKKTLAATGRWDATEFAWTSNLSYREIGLSKSTFALV
ncbi:B12 binding domain protein [Pirellulimonas nuda]|uniref:B12 binding domain protein n=1 Tax=Pirellulimonas nuda TaxID=2528009 RepID=A0A518DCN0_9BACT|nr:radical SAM protein [Pirellulimonas nuda]QDU89237.1 B12 binding domain protein [Pirellulimonas nuda]